MLHLHRHCLRGRALLNLNNTLSPPCYYYLLLRLRPHYPSSSLMISYSNTSSSSSSSDHPQPFTLSYLTNTRGFSPQAALKASKRVRFDTPQKPDSVIAFFRNHGFSNTQIHSIILRAPELLAFDPIKTLLPKFQFLSSKGASSFQIVAIVTRCPRFICTSLDNHIIPAFQLVRSFCPSDQIAIASIIACPSSICDNRMKPNINFLLHQVGVTPSSIYHLLRTRPSTICSADLRNVVEEIKALGFDPSKSIFSVALLTKRAVTKSQWDAKVCVLKNWGYSEDAISKAFRKHPNFMLRSPEKLEAVMSFWIGKLRWDPLVLTAAPVLFGFSLQKRLIPRASVLNHLLSKGLIKKGASLSTPFCLTDQLFLKRWVNRFEEETPRLLTLYKEGC